MGINLNIWPFDQINKTKRNGKNGDNMLVSLVQFVKRSKLKEKMTERILEVFFSLQKHNVRTSTQLKEANLGGLSADVLISFVWP